MMPSHIDHYQEGLQFDHRFDRSEVILDPSFTNEYPDTSFFRHGPYEKNLSG